jgi:D-alanyl-D-alanine carboxypeptidase
MPRSRAGRRELARPRAVLDRRRLPGQGIDSRYAALRGALGGALRRFVMRTLRTSSTSALVIAILLALPLTAGARTTDAAVKRGLEALVAAKGGPPGVIATLYRRGRLVVLAAGRSNVARRGAPRASDHMRIASVAKAYGAAIVLKLVQQGRLGLDDTIAMRLPSMPRRWGAVTIREMLNHTSGVPDYTRSDAFFEHVKKNPRGFVLPTTVVGWVRNKPLDFTPGSRYEYSNTDNIVIGLIAERVTGKPYGMLLRELVFRPARLRQTSFPTTLAMPTPFIHGYVVRPGAKPADVTRSLNPSGAWASGGIVSTPAEVAAFIRADLGRVFFGAAQQRQQLRFVPGASSPPGPGTNAAGLGIFRYRTRCGTVYGHTGNFPGYTQWVAATADGTRSVTTSLNIPAPSGALLSQLRAVQASAVCALLGN